MPNRRATRVNFFSDGEIRTVDHREVAAVVDISLNGVLLSTKNPSVAFKVDDVVEVEVRLNDMGLVMAFGGRVVRTDAGSIGVAFEDMDIDTATHLRRLIELNTGEPALVERPMSALGG